MPRIYLSLSTQEKNKGVGDYGTEEYRMHQIGDIIESRLKEHGFVVFRSTKDQILIDIIKESNTLNVDIHVAVHSNASANGLARGCEVWVCKGSNKGRKLGEILYKYLEAITPVKDRGVKETTKLTEVVKTTAPAALIEVSFHDNPDDAKWIIENISNIAEAIVKGICEYFDVKYIPPQLNIQPVLEKLNIVLQKLEKIEKFIDYIKNAPP